MTTQTYTSTVLHTNDAEFRTWASNLHNAIIGSGLVQTTDSGQADLTTANRPGVNSFVYKIYRFDDAQQGAAPVFIRINYGTGSATSPRITAIVGSGSDGSGGITGIVSGTINVTGSGGASILSGEKTTRVCAVDGAFWFSWLLGAQSVGAAATFAVVRSVNSDGSPSGDGLQIYQHSSGQAVTTRVHRYTSAESLALTNGSHCLIVGGFSSSMVGGSAQVFKHYMPLPRVRPHPWVLTVLSSEYGNNTQFKATPVGAMQRNYVSLGVEGVNANTQCALPSFTGQTFALIWE